MEINDISIYIKTLDNGVKNLERWNVRLRLILTLWAALPSNPTRGKSHDDQQAALRAYHPLWAMATVKLDFDLPARPSGDSPKRDIPRGQDDL